MAREVDFTGLNGEKIVVPPGATLAVLMSAQPCQGSAIVKYFSGGSLEIVAAPVGTTWTGASLVNLLGTGYLFGASEVLTVDGSARYYLMATGATVVAYGLRGLTPGSTLST